MKKLYLAKPLFAAACAAFFCSFSPLRAGILPDSDNWHDETYDYGELLGEPDTFFVSSDASSVDGYYYKASFGVGPMSYSHYWSDFLPYFGGGFTYSNCTDVETPGYMNMSAFAGSGYGDDTYLLANSSSFTPASVTQGQHASFAPREAYFTNATYAALSMLQGDAVAKKFGGADGTDPDWFRLVIRGYLQGEPTAEPVVFYLADYRSDNPAEDYVVKDWTRVDLTPLGVVDSLAFELESSDTGDWGINTPTYFCMDHLVVGLPGAVGVEEVFGGAQPGGRISYSGGMLRLRGMAGESVAVYSLSGLAVETLRPDSDDYSRTLSLAPGYYVVRTAQGSLKICVE